MRRAIASAVLAAGLVLVTSGAVLADDINGTQSDDELIGTNDADNIWGRGGDDNIAGLAGADNLFGNASNDILCGQEDSDTYSGGWGNDILAETECGPMGPPGQESGVSGAPIDTGNEIMRGDEGADFIEGGTGDDWIFGDRGSENITIAGLTFALLYGGDGDDHIFGGRESDAMEGEAGDDILRGNRGQDTIDAANEEGVGDSDDVNCGPGYDVAIVNADDTYVNCEEVTIVPAPTSTSSDPSGTNARQDRAREAFLRANFR